MLHPYEPRKGELWIPMIPVAKGRPRLAFGHVHNPQKTVNAEGAIQSFFLHYNKRSNPINCAMKVSVDFYFKSKSICHHLKRPDLDNLVKLVTDALGPQRDKATGKWLDGLLYTDDSLIVELHIRKSCHPNQGVWFRYETVPDLTHIQHPLDPKVSVYPSLEDIIKEHKDHDLTSIPIAMLERVAKK